MRRIGILLVGTLLAAGVAVWVLNNWTPVVLPEDSSRWITAIGAFASLMGITFGVWRWQAITDARRGATKIGRETLIIASVGVALYAFLAVVLFSTPGVPPGLPFVCVGFAVNSFLIYVDVGAILKMRESGSASTP